MSFTTHQIKYFSAFWRYVECGWYSKFVRDLLKRNTQDEVNAINREIREVYLPKVRSDFPELGSIELTEDDSTLMVEHIDVLREIIPTLVRLMVGNHGVYIEFDQPVEKGRYVQMCKQYYWYELNFMKFYQQFKTVNYADYKEGLWYVSLYDAMQKPEPTKLDYIQ
jgi:hypothetical protein